MDGGECGHKGKVQGGREIQVTLIERENGRLTERSNKSEDDTIKRYRGLKGPNVKGDQEVRFEVEEGVLYRVYRHPFVNRVTDK